MTRRVVFILAMHGSGSHLLSQLLGAHSRCLSIGELNGLRAPSALEGRKLLNDYATNPLFNDLASLHEHDWHRRIFTNAATYRPQATTLIDNSKQVDWARRFADAGDFIPHYIHLLRDPRAFHPRQRRAEFSRGARIHARRRLMRHGSRWWLDAWLRPIDVVRTLEWIAINQSIDSFMRGRPGSIVLYEELADDPARCLTRLMPELGLWFEPTQLAYGRAPQAGTLQREHLGASARSIIRKDLRWQSELPVDTVRRAAAIRALGRYLEASGLTLSASGLRHIRTGPDQAPTFPGVSIPPDAGPEP